DSTTTSTALASGQTRRLCDFEVLLVEAEIMISRGEAEIAYLRERVYEI
ncbi:hypothetical protein TorRG33x02_282340, partial [Trema orientale]